MTYTDALGRERRCLCKDLPHFKQMDRDLRGGDRTPPPGDAPPRVEEEEIDAGPVHYQQRKNNEIRTLGVGYFKFSTDEEARQQEMAALNKMREETIANREKQDKLKKRRAEAATDRLKKIKMRKEGLLAKDLAAADAEPTPDNAEDGSGVGAAAAAAAAPFSDVDGMLDFYQQLVESKAAAASDAAGPLPPSS